jgi:hypothetical protein
MDALPTVSAPSATPSPVEVAKPKTEGLKRRRAADPVDREAKARERTLRNRAAAQLSREKKRRYLDELEQSNVQLRQDNTMLTGRLTSLEQDNHQLLNKLDTVSMQLNMLQTQMTWLASLATQRSNAAIAAMQSPAPSSMSTPELSISQSPMLRSDSDSEPDLEHPGDKTKDGSEAENVDFGESAVLTKLAPERRANSLQRKSTSNSSCPSWPNRSVLLQPFSLSLNSTTSDSGMPQPPHPCLVATKRDAPSQLCKQQTSLAPPPPPLPSPPCLITKAMALMTLSLVWSTLNYLMRRCEPKTAALLEAAKQIGPNIRCLPTWTPSTFCPTNSYSIPCLPPRLTRFFESSMECHIDRDEFRRLMIGWVCRVRQQFGTARTAGLPSTGRPPPPP